MYYYEKRGSSLNIIIFNLFNFLILSFLAQQEWFLAPTISRCNGESELHIYLQNIWVLMFVIKSLFLLSLLMVACEGSY